VFLGGGKNRPLGEKISTYYKSLDVDWSDIQWWVTLPIPPLDISLNPYLLSSK
jgi:hypothetical protein